MTGPASLSGSHELAAQPLSAAHRATLIPIQSEGLEALCADLGRSR
jgi:hypothetical protein